MLITRASGAYRRERESISAELFSTPVFGSSELSLMPAFQ